MKHIKFEAISTPGSNFQSVTVTLLQQTRRGYQFGEAGNAFTSNGIILKSVSRPEVRESENTIYLRGGAITLDNEKLVMSVKMFDKFKKAVEAYNAKFADMYTVKVAVATCPAATCVQTVG